MNVKQILFLCTDLLASEARKSPGKTLVVNGHPETYERALEELRRLTSWLYPGLDTVEIRKVTICKDCQYFKRYKKKDCRKPVYKYACTLCKDDSPTPSGFCVHAKEKEDL